MNKSPTELLLKLFAAELAALLKEEFQPSKTHYTTANLPDGTSRNAFHHHCRTNPAAVKTGKVWRIAIGDYHARPISSPTESELSDEAILAMRAPNRGAK